MSLDTAQAYLLLGSNLGNRERYLEQALLLINERIGKINAQSAIYETAAWGKTDQPAFLNLAVGVITKLEPLALLHGVLTIEKDLGRTRKEKWGSRSIDIDVILYNDQVVDIAGELQIPHPEMQYRKFVMQPLAEIAPLVVHPILKQDLISILSALDDPLMVQKR